MSVERAVKVDEIYSCFEKVLVGTSDGEFSF